MCVDDDTLSVGGIEFTRKQMYDAINERVRFQGFLLGWMTLIYGWGRDGCLEHIKNAQSGFVIRNQKR